MKHTVRVILQRRRCGSGGRVVSIADSVRNVRLTLLLAPSSRYVLGETVKLGFGSKRKMILSELVAMLAS